MLSADAPLEVFEEIDSTIVEARRRAEFGDFGPVWLLARVQSAGRGRRGRAWATIPGNLFATYLGAAAAKPAEIALLGFAAGLAIAQTCDWLIGEGRAKLKWPNDLMLDGAKAAGIMLDSGSIAGGHWFALAFGVNIVGHPESLDQQTASIAQFMSAPPPSPETLLADIRTRLEPWSAILVRDGFAPLRKAWLARAFGLNQPARVILGEETIAGIVRGLSVNGELEIETPSGVRYISAGDIHFPPAAS